ncbi:hypothetical protein RJ640_018297 [Escallonia rubra]|uniref:GAG-pre-integrase domain-containing protein n=1 Tax=Escallonia rubra TaxID=112253 RepID=A0AA88RX38_9ASTE|nr:hypothetical protein RJ640_018297 [Escallonia rubra]
MVVEKLWREGVILIGDDFGGVVARKDCPKRKEKKKDNSKTTDAGVAEDNSDGADVLSGSTVTGVAASTSSFDIDSDTTKLWHMRLGHMSERGMDVLSKQGLLGSKKIRKLDFYEHCVFGKQCRVKFSRLFIPLKMRMMVLILPRIIKDLRNSSITLPEINREEKFDLFRIYKEGNKAL